MQLSEVRAPKIKPEFVSGPVMPIYDYSCNKCGEVFEALVLKTLPAPKCPKCEGESLKQLISRQFAVDSSTTRAASSKVQKARAAAIRKDYAIAQREYEKNHEH